MSLSRFTLENRIAIVTGTTSGLGQAMAEALAGAGAHIAAVGSSGAGGSFWASRPTSRKWNQSRRSFSRRAMPSAASISSSIRRNHPPHTLHRPHRAGPGPGHADQPPIGILPGPGGGPRVHRAENRRQDHQRRIAPEPSGQDPCPLLHGGQVRHHAHPRQRVGPAGHQRERHRPGLLRHAGKAAFQKDPTRNRAILDRIPAGRWGRPADPAGIVIFLASAASEYCHGGIYPVDGGWLAR